MNSIQQHIEQVRADASQKYSNFAGQDGLKSKNQSHLLAQAKFRAILAVDGFKKGLVHILNKAGIATGSNEYDNVLISKTVNGLKMRNNFKDDLVNLIKSVTGKKGFADQSNGLIKSLNANDIVSSLYNSGKDFVPNENFVSNCKNCSGEYKNFSFSDITDAIQYGVNTWSADQQRQLEETKVQAATTIEATKLAELKAKIAELEAKQAAAKSGTSGTVKVIIAVGVVGILGIASFFYFKKKKIS